MDDGNIPLQEVEYNHLTEWIKTQTKPFKLGDCYFRQRKNIEMILGIVPYSFLIKPSIIRWNNMIFQDTAFGMVLMGASKFDTATNFTHSILTLTVDEDIINEKIKTRFMLGKKIIGEILEIELNHSKINYKTSSNLMCPPPQITVILAMRLSQ